MAIIKALMLSHFLFVANLELNINDSSKYLPIVGIESNAPWCAAYLNYVLIKSGNYGTFSPLAKSFLNLGNSINPLSDAKKGDLVILKRGKYDWQGHVGIFYGFTLDMEYVILLGGDQTKMVSFRRFKYNNIIEIVRVFL